MMADQAVFSFPHSKLVPSTQMQWRITAILRATATFAFFMPSVSTDACPKLLGPTISVFGA